MQVRCWQMESTSWSFLRKPVAQVTRRESMTQPLPEPLTNQPLSLPWVSVWKFPRSAVSSCLNSP